jgi:hypothetical protein
MTVIPVRSSAAIAHQSAQVLSHLDGLLADTKHVFDEELIKGPVLGTLAPALRDETPAVFEQGIHLIVKVRQ